VIRWLVLFLVAALVTLAAVLGVLGNGEAHAGLDWRTCGRTLECAKLEVPLDYANAAGKTIELALVRRPASDPERRLGSLVFNPGGPGVSGVEYFEYMQSGLDEQLVERFDFVGFDPRGVGKSNPIRCGYEHDGDMALDPLPDTPAELEELAVLVREFGAACQERNGDVLPFLGTVNVARDLDRIREALGDDKLTYVGFSYGTRLGSVYAHLFPGRVRALVLDGAMYPSATWRQQARDQARALETALGRFFADCAARSKCAIGPQPARVWDDIARRLERAPFETTLDGEQRLVGGGHLHQGAYMYLLSGRYGWPFLEKALAELRSGRGSLLLELEDYFVTAGNELDAGPAIFCLDESERPSNEEVVRFARLLEADFPRTASASVLVCPEGWPAPPDPVPAVRAAGALPILVLGTTYDSATPYVWSSALASALESGVLVTYRGDGHTAFLTGQPCVDEIVTDYLVDLVVPKPGTVCIQDPN
jgi:pimeloyl-ACP methyl ester carboxylesterase